jgi:hypothetical protein
MRKPVSPLPFIKVLTNAGRGWLDQVVISQNAILPLFVSWIRTAKPRDP